MFRLANCDSTVLKNKRVSVSQTRNPVLSNPAPINNLIYDGHGPFSTNNINISNQIFSMNNTNAHIHSKNNINGYKNNPKRDRSEKIDYEKVDYERHYYSNTKNYHKNSGIKTRVSPSNYFYIFQ